MPETAPFAGLGGSPRWRGEPLRWAAETLVRRWMRLGLLLDVCVFCFCEGSSCVGQLICRLRHLLGVMFWLKSFFVSLR